MSAQILNGKEIAKNIRKKLTDKIDLINVKHNIKLALASIIVGDDPASSSYIKNNEKVCMETGIKPVTYRLPYDTTQDELIKLINELNNRSDIHGILMQVPLPEHINENVIASTISEFKDVDCFNPQNSGKLFRGEKCIYPCTPKGIIRLIKETGIDIKGKNAAVVGRSNIVGKPAAMMLLNNNATVTVCHSKTTNLKEILKNCDIVVSAVGKPGFINGDMIKDGAVVIDAGTTMVNGKLKGDIDFDSAAQKASFITPVPGGVGSMTTTMLVENILEASGYDD